jgi:hypothetical protein
MGLVVIGDQRSLDGLVGWPVMPDGGSHGQQPLGDTCVDALGGPAAVKFDAELTHNDCLGTYSAGPLEVWPTCGHSRWSATPDGRAMQGSSKSAVHIERTAHSVPLGGVSADQRGFVVRGGVEPPTFRFPGQPSQALCGPAKTDVTDKRNRARRKVRNQANADRHDPSTGYCVGA